MPVFYIFFFFFFIRMENIFNFDFGSRQQSNTKGVEKAIIFLKKIYFMVYGWMCVL